MNEIDITVTISDHKVEVNVEDAARKVPKNELMAGLLDCN